MKATVLRNELAHLVLEDAHDIAFFVVDDARRVREWPASAERLLGYLPESVVGRDVSVLFAADERVVPPSGGMGATVRLNRGDGTSLVADLMARPLAGGGSAVLLRDVTERHRLRSEVARSHEQYRRLFRNNPYPTWVFCRDSLRFMDVNDAAIRTYGWSRDEFLAMTIADIRPPEDVPALLVDLARMRDTPQGRGGPWRHWHKDGTVVEVEISFTNLPFEGRSARLVVADDVTARRRAMERRARLLARIVSAQEDERRRVSRELHDAVGQSLTALNVGLRELEHATPVEDVRRRIDKLRAIAADTVREVNRLSRGLRPSALDDLGLDAALSQYASDWAALHAIAVDFSADGIEGCRLSVAAETALYRIAQEALTNVARHARARAVEVRLRREPGAIVLTVRDDGTGFAMEHGQEDLGIAGMRERAELLGGSCQIESQPGRGTLVRVQLPFEAAR